MITVTTTRRIIDANKNIVKFPYDKLSNEYCSINTNEFLFYSNNPEKVYNKDLADNGKWLCRETITGNGQIYTWHETACSMPITSTILIYNPNDFDVKISASNYGLTNRPNWQSDIIAWEDYFSSRSPIEKTVHANGYDNIFSQSIPAVGNGGNVFGIVSRLSVSDLNGKPASVVLFDLAYAVDSSSAIECAEAEDYDTTLRYRGLGKGFYETFNLPVLNIDETNDMWGFKFGSLADSFNGKDLIQMTDSSQKLSPNRLSGNYGVQMSLTYSPCLKAGDSWIQTILAY